MTATTLVRIAVVLIVASLLFASSSTANVAVEVVSRNDAQYDYRKPPDCHLRMSGEIASGDSERLQQAVTRFREHYKGDIIYLCLNSNGGNYPETLKIVEWLVSGEGRGIGTVVPAGAKCFSACAFMFMAGNYEYDHGQVLARWLHVRAQLGFHAPYIPETVLPDRPYSRTELLETYRLAMAAAQKMLAIFGQGRWSERDQHPEPWMKASLIQATLVTGPKDLILIDTVDKAGRWDIPIYGGRWAGPITPRKAVIACWNHIAWSQDKFSGFTSERALSFLSPEKMKTKGDGVSTFSFALLWEDSGQLYWDKPCDIIYAGNTLFHQIFDGTTNDVLPNIGFYEPNTSISALAPAR